MSPAQLVASEPMRARGTFAATTVDGRDGVLPAGYFEFDDQHVGFRHDAADAGRRHRSGTRRARTRGVAIGEPRFRSRRVPNPVRGRSRGCASSSSRSSWRDPRPASSCATRVPT